MFTTTLINITLYFHNNILTDDTYDYVQNCANLLCHKDNIKIIDFVGKLIKKCNKLVHVYYNIH